MELICFNISQNYSEKVETVCFRISVFFVSFTHFCFCCSYELSRQLEPPEDLCSPTPWSHRTLTKKLSSWVSRCWCCLNIQTYTVHIHFTVHTDLHIKHLKTGYGSGTNSICWPSFCHNINGIYVCFFVLSLLTVSDVSKKLPADQISVTSSGSSGSEMEDLSSPNTACSIRLQVNKLFVCLCVFLPPCLLFSVCPLSSVMLTVMSLLEALSHRAFVSGLCLWSVNSGCCAEHNRPVLRSQTTPPRAFLIRAQIHWMKLA